MPGYGTVLEPSPQYPAPGRFGCCLLDVPPVTGETHTHSLPRGSTVPVHAPKPASHNSRLPHMHAALGTPWVPMMCIFPLPSVQTVSSVSAELRRFLSAGEPHTKPLGSLGFSPPASCFFVHEQLGHRENKHGASDCRPHIGYIHHRRSAASVFRTHGPNEARHRTNTDLEGDYSQNDLWAYLDSRRSCGQNDGTSYKCHLEIFVRQVNQKTLENR